MKMKTLVKEITRRLKYHHDKLYKEIPVTGDYWESTLFESLKAVGDTHATWNLGSHNIGADIFKTQYGNISCKSGLKRTTRAKDTKLVINGSRTGNYPTIKEKKKFFAKKKEDVYFCLARIKKEWARGEKTYYLCVFKPLDHAGLDWKKTVSREGKFSGWSGSNQYMDCTIRNTMSEQVWSDISEDYFDEQYTITIR